MLAQLWLLDWVCRAASTSEVGWSLWKDPVWTIRTLLDRLLLVVLLVVLVMLVHTIVADSVASLAFILAAPRQPGWTPPQNTEIWTRAGEKLRKQLGLNG